MKQILTRKELISSFMFDKIIDFLRPWTHVMKHTQSSRVSSIHTVAPSILVINSSLEIRADFYFNLEIDDEDYADQHGSSKASSHTLEIDLHFKHGADKMPSLTNSGQENEEYNRLSFWKMKHVSYPIVAMVATRVLTVLATRAAVEREFSFTGNIITQKYSKSSSDTLIREINLRSDPFTEDSIQALKSSYTKLVKYSNHQRKKKRSINLMDHKFHIVIKCKDVSLLNLMTLVRFTAPFK
ncbi:unnamed protein product [Rotaria sordida]|uniref:HAT C-terminal dimerisation domain-containing protein n=1 Tax=Rotaria sordida TaxID=392033 RepID=A0A819WVC8_9BILA|nr:unnamed protein product [Rotaria sordida]